MKQVVILRGISGAGKSTYIKKHFPFAEICSADHFFIQKNGKYVFNPKQIAQAHSACKAKFKAALSSKKPIIVVDNTNTKIWEFSYYLEMAEKYGYDISVVRLNPDWKTAAKRNQHGVPEEKVKEMNDRMEPFPGETVLSTY